MLALLKAYTYAPLTGQQSFPAVGMGTQSKLYPKPFLWTKAITNNKSVTYIKRNMNCNY